MVEVGSAVQATSQHVQEEAAQQQRQQALDSYADHLHTAEIYHAYSVIHSITSKPFREVQASTVLHAACFLLARLHAAPAPEGVLLSGVAFALAQEAVAQQAWKAARFAYLKLQTLKVRRIPAPTGWPVLCG